MADPDPHLRPMLPSLTSLTTGRVLLACVAVSSLAGLGLAQVQSVGNAPLSRSAFAPPWAVTFQHIQDAMRGKFGTYAVEQTRRVFETKASAGTKYVGTLERLLYLPADAASKTKEQFKLGFQGIEGRKLTSGEFASLATLFDGKAAFTFRYMGFHVADAALAAKTYDLIFLTQAKRATMEGVVDVYRMVAIPKLWDRTAWLLELDTRTGYPLYAGEYSFDAKNTATLQSEVLVKSYLTGVRTPGANDASWWSPIKGIEITATAQAALKKALTQSTAYVVPSLTELPGGYQLAGSEVHIDPFRGKRSAVLRYTDGVDHMFVTERNVPVTVRAADDTIAFLDMDGVTRCAFTHRGVNFDVIGRERESVRGASIGIYSRAIRVLK